MGDTFHYFRYFSRIARLLPSAAAAEALSSRTRCSRERIPGQRNFLDVKIACCVITTLDGIGINTPAFTPVNADGTSMGFLPFLVDTPIGRKFESSFQ
ncbi:hypothetical protein [Geotalea toluenoxydans]|uniref:hypothetical protein n=1 Tax=Geotalea toluenoxydans TaxID=421624 RepID=UPI001FB27481|nr:hypothetical protein [Geotalea toluenoxydans]